jgi:hypothetical protein
MRVLLYLNGAEGYQTGIEDGFQYLKEQGRITELQWFYFQEYERNNGHQSTIEQIVRIAQEFLPDIIVFYHLARFRIDEATLMKIKGIASKPLMAYDEGDMYGGITKPMSSQMKTVMKVSDVVSVRGLGAITEQIKKINPAIIYTPHHADIARFDCEPYILEKREYPMVLIGNKVQSRILSSLFSIPGAKERERIIKYIDKHFPDEFHLFGNGWSGIRSHRGTVDFQKQIEVYRNSWVTVAYEHYPGIANYFSNRLPIALLAGSLYVCHYHQGYENIFKNCDFIFFYKTEQELYSVLKYLFSLNEENLLERSRRARAFALANYTPQVVWRNFFENIQKAAKKHE